MKKHFWGAITLLLMCCLMPLHGRTIRETMSKIEAEGSVIFVGEDKDDSILSAQQVSNAKARSIRAILTAGNITNDIFTGKHLNRFTNLQVLILSGFSALDPNFLKAFSKKLRCLIFGPTDMDDQQNSKFLEGVFPRRVKGETYLGVERAPNLTGKFLKKVRNMTHLSVDKLDNFEDTNLKLLKEPMKLNEFVAYDCPKVTGDGFKFCQNLTIVWLGNCKGFKDENITLLTNVEKLSVQGCNQVTDKYLDRLTKLKRFVCKPKFVEDYPYAIKKLKARGVDVTVVKSAEVQIPD